MLSIFGNYEKWKHTYLIFHPVLFIYLRLWENQRCLLYQVQGEEVFKEIIQNQKPLSSISPWTSLNPMNTIVLSSFSTFKANNAEAQPDCIHGSENSLSPFVWGEILKSFQKYECINYSCRRHASPGEMLSCERPCLRPSTLAALLQAGEERSFWSTFFLAPIFPADILSLDFNGTCALSWWLKAAE